MVRQQSSKIAVTVYYSKINYTVHVYVSGNFVAVGTTESFINIWDIDTINCLKPVATLTSSGKVLCLIYI